MKGAIHEEESVPRFHWYDRAVRIWDLKSGRLIEHPGPANYRPDQIRFLQGSQHLIIQWADPGGKYDDATIQMLNAKDGEVVLHEKLRRGTLVSAVNAGRVAFITAAGEALLLKDQPGARNIRSQSSVANRKS